jgi:membrane protease YdiL (CAAX protease family)
VLLASGSRGWSDRIGLVASSVLFGLWHVLPTWNDTGRATALAAAGGQRVLVVLGTVVATGIAGAVFAWLRRRSGSLLAPVLAHLAVNAAALTAAWVVRG